MPDTTKVVEEARKIIASGKYQYGQSRAGDWQHDSVMDCSEFVYQSYRNAGFLTFLYTNSSSMAAHLKTVTDPRPGDIVSWPGHVGIVEDPDTGDFLNAMSKKSGLGRANYKTNTYWAGRVGRKFLRFGE